MKTKKKEASGAGRRLHGDKDEDRIEVKRTSTSLKTTSNILKSFPLDEFRIQMLSFMFKTNTFALPPTPKFSFAPSTI